MRNYTVYYCIKRDKHGYLRHHDVEAKNQREAIRQTQIYVKESTGRHAFWCTCKAPVETDKGLDLVGGVFTRWYKPWRQLW